MFPVCLYTYYCLPLLNRPAGRSGTQLLGEQADICLPRRPAKLLGEKMATTQQAGSSSFHLLTKQAITCLLSRFLPACQAGHHLLVEQVTSRLLPVCQTGGFLLAKPAWRAPKPAHQADDGLVGSRWQLPARQAGHHLLGEQQMAANFLPSRPSPAG